MFGEIAINRFLAGCLDTPHSASAAWAETGADRRCRPPRSVRISLPIASAHAAVGASAALQLHACLEGVPGDVCRCPSPGGPHYTGRRLGR